MAVALPETRFNAQNVQNWEGAHTMIRPSIRISILSYNHMTTFVRYMKNMSVSRKRALHTRANLLQVFEDHILGK
jgi:hypothetical protein